MPEAVHSPRLIPVQPTSAGAESRIQNAKRIEKIQSLSSSHRTAGTVELHGQEAATITRAYQIWEEGGCKYGQSDKDWYQAIKEINDRLKKPETKNHTAKLHNDGISPYSF